jgi:hypothetical protein
LGSDIWSTPAQGQQPYSSHQSAQQAAPGPISRDGAGQCIEPLPIHLDLSLGRLPGRSPKPHHQLTLAANVSRSSLTTIMMRVT